MDMTPIDIVDLQGRYDVKMHSNHMVLSIVATIHNCRHTYGFNNEHGKETLRQLFEPRTDLVERIGAIHAPLRKDHKTYPLSIRWYDVFLFHRCGYRCLFAWGRFLQFLQLSCTRFLRVSHPSLFSSWTELRKCNNDMKRGKSDWPHWDDGVFGWSWTIWTFTTGGHFVQANLFPRD